jgi:predicted O-methyltransferase YrrM
MKSERSSGKRETLSPAKILGPVYAFREARVLLTAFDLDLFSLIGSEQKSSEEVAALARTDPRATDRLLDAICASGYLLKKNSKFSNTPLTLHFLVKGQPGYLGGLMHQVSLWNTWTTLTDAVRKGSSVAVHTTMSQHGVDWLEAFITAMHMRAISQAPAIVGLISLKGVSRILDVGGGSGVFSMAFVRARKGITATVFDLPDVAKMAKEYIGNENLSHSIKVVEGDYAFDSLGSGFDIVFMSAVIHSNSPEMNQRLFRKAFEALNPGGRLVVLDYMMNAERTSPTAGAYFSLNMLVGTHEGDTYTESEVRSWMEGAGFEKVRRTNTEFETDLVIGKRKN